ncbi:MAG TPA: SbmA/BacA-like family transporter [Devosiaceae bacterium]|nr:SbmA/BacA-like family transporter [Devosiaceae bacterium]
MFRSFFPVPKQFFASVVLWLLVSILIWYTVGDPIRSIVGIDRFLAPAICAPGAVPEAPLAEDPALGQRVPTVDVVPTPEPPAAGAGLTNPNAPAPTESTAPPIADCVVEDTNFLNAERIWSYQFVVLISVLFCVFWYFYKRNEWYWWSVVGSTGILLFIYFNVQIDAFVNDWSGTFFNTMQLALTEPGSVEPDTFYGQIFIIFAVLLPNILALVLLGFFTSHYVFRWRKAMNSYYMAYWPEIRTTEGAAQRVQEDTMRFASIVEDLGTSFFSSLITLAVFLPLLWTLSENVTELPLLGAVPGGLVWVALIAAALGTVLLAAVGFKLPGLNFNNQLVEAAYRKELVYGEDNADRADPATTRELFARVQKNYFRLYFHYTYFNLARYGYLQTAGYIPLLALAPSILAGTLTLGVYQQVSLAFGQVSSSFQFFARAWTTIVELQSIYARLRRFESFIPHDQEPIKESLTPVTT